MFIIIRVLTNCIIVICRDDDRDKPDMKPSSSEESVKRQTSNSNDLGPLEQSQAIWSTVPNVTENTANDMKMIINPTREVLETTV